MAPLADRMRPQTLDDYVGQEAVVGKGSLLRGLLDSGSAGSLVLVSVTMLNPRFARLYLFVFSGGHPAQVGC